MTDHSQGVPRPAPDGRVHRSDDGSARVGGPCGWHVVDLLLLTAVAGVMARLTWRGWADPLVDFGRELYVPWRIVEGARLYTDLGWFNGPLSPHLNALWFRVFGPGVAVLQAANAVVLGASVLLIRHIVLGMADRLTAGVAAALFLLVFAFGQYVGIANYNWMAPYSHEVTHGVALSLGCLAALGRWRVRGSPIWLAVGGIALGLAFLTKVETFLAAAAASSILLALSDRRSLRTIALFSVAALAPPVASLVLFGLSGTLGAWPSVLAGEVAQLPYYRAGMGLDEPLLRMEEILAWGAIWIIVLLAPVGAAWLARETSTPLAGWISAVATLVLFVVVRSHVPWTEALRPLQLAVAVVLVGLAIGRIRDPDAAPPPEAIAFGALGLVLLGKMLLNVRVAHYGFALAAPASLFTVVALLRWLPDLLDRRGMRGTVLRGAVVGLLAVFAFAHVSATRSRMEPKTYEIGTGADAMRTDVRGAFVQLAVDHLRTSGARTAAVLPEGVMINYLARVPNPTPYLNFMPPEEVLFGAAAWEAAFRAWPPDRIVIVPKDTAEFGRGPLGVGYGTLLTEWIRSEYRPEATLRVEGVDYSVQVLVRRDYPT